MAKAHLYKKLLFSILELSQMTGLGKTSIYNAIADGKLVAKKYGARTVIPLSSVEQWIENLPEKTQQEDF